LDEAVSDLTAAGLSALAIPMDVEDEASICAGYDLMESSAGPVDAVIVCAGMSVHATSIELSAEDLTRIFRVNTIGLFLTAREAARRMMRRPASPGFYRILLISSIAGSRQYLGVVPKVSPAYCASKAGVDMLGSVFAREWASNGINVNTIVPGHVKTEVNAAWTLSEGGQRRIARFPRQSMVALDSLDPLVRFLLSPDASQITGSSFLVDDAQTL
jgi:NAD(P)-dependent dehydrogenase (short-subunit alcohol dehydrogenase family)